MVVRKLFYGDGKGYGEGLRYLLHYGGLEFEDVRIPTGEFATYKKTHNFPFGKVPVYMEDDRVLHQSQVIAKYIGKQVGLVPSDPWEEAQLETVPQTLGDFAQEFRAFMHEQDPEKKEELKQKVLGEKFDYYFSKFDKLVAENNGHFGKKLSWVDITFVAMVGTLRDYVGINIDKYESLKALEAEVQGLKGIKEYIERTTK